MQQNQDSCGCNDYSKKWANTGIAQLSTANPHLDGTGTTATAITAARNGTIIKSVMIKATGQVTKGMVRLFISNGTGTSLYKEISTLITHFKVQTRNDPH